MLGVRVTDIKTVLTFTHTKKQIDKVPACYQNCVGRKSGEVALLKKACT